jgi:hypothetical protein
MLIAVDSNVREYSAEYGRNWTGQASRLERSFTTFMKEDNNKVEVLIPAICKDDNCPFSVVYDNINMFFTFMCQSVTIYHAYIKVHA